ncbi:MAG: hypothetical protein B6I36_10145 [Desulfobacteraceae bacterium 4572_35.1]|nr:MAG: hypothetical protein B6I36_10145 [Desulfobacteraceae bacterium 4572_35.1]
MTNKKQHANIESLTEKINQLKPFRSVIGEKDFSSLQGKINELRRNIDTASEQNRLLRIGVVGQIKRGKSSFLNSLLFNGDDVLPKAASPMTAALTRIRYGEKLTAEVEFYDKDEWAQVETTAEKGFDKERQRLKAQDFLSKKGTGGFFSKRNDTAPTIMITEKPTPAEQACMELVEMAKHGRQDIQGYLGKKVVLDPVEHISELNQILADYVGSAGHFTPFVKSSCLSVNLPALKNIEIIDTPGINDPIVSRSSVTKKFMGQCDVIFFLSNCGQFLDQSDLSLLAQSIPKQGIDDICLIGSLFDSVLLDEGHRYKSLRCAAPVIVEKLNQRAEEDFNKICQQIEHCGENPYMAKALKGALPPLFISAMAFNIATHWGAHNEIEKKILTSLEKMFPDDTFDKETMLELANLEIVHTRVEQVTQRKEEILKGKMDKLLQRTEPAFRQEMGGIRERLVKEQEAIASGSIEELTASLDATAKKLGKGKSAVTHIFETHANSIKKNMATVMHEIKLAALDAKRVSRRSGTDTKEERYTVSSSKWWNPFSWGSSETKWRTVTISYSSANVHDAIDQVEGFIQNAEKGLTDHISEAVNVDQLRKDILAAVKKMVDVESDDFDPDNILRPVESAVSRITKPSVNLNCSACIAGVTSSFNTPEVRDADISRLQQSIADAVSIALQTINKAVLHNQEKICNELNKSGQSFISDISKDLEHQIKSLNSKKDNVERSLKEYAEVLQVIDSQI